MEIITISPLLAQSPNSQPGNGSGDDHPRRIIQRGPLLQQRSKLADEIEHAADVQVHHLGKGTVGVGVELLAPRGAGVGEEDVDMAGLLGHFCDEVLDPFERGAVGGDGDCALGGRVHAGEGV